MADNCCNPITPASCVTRCPQLVNACCVINKDNLPCINPPVTVTGSGVSGQSSIRLSEVISEPDFGNFVVTDASGCIPDDTEIISFNGSSVNLSNTLTCTFQGNPITITLVNQRQCDINKAFDEKLCTPSGCPEWNIITDYSDPIMDITWGTTIGSEVAVSNPIGCIVRFTGSVSSAKIDPASDVTIQSQLFVLPSGLWPSARRALSLTVILTASSGLGLLLLPGVLLIETDGAVKILFSNLNPILPADSGCTPAGCGDTMATPEPYWSGDVVINFSLDGLTFNTI
jgi:hypothetical protein